MGIYRAFLEEEVPHLDSTNDPDGQIAELEKIVKDSDANEAEQDDAQEAAFGPDGGVDDIMAESWMAIAEFETGNNDIMKAIGYHELNEAVEGREFMFESMDDIKGFFKSAKDKIIAFFKKVWSVIQRWTGNLTSAMTSNKKFAEKYSAEINAGYGIIQREKGRKKMKGYTFAGLDPMIKSISTNKTSAVITDIKDKAKTDIDKKALSSPEEITERVNRFRGDLMGANEGISQGDFSSRLKKELFGEDEPKELWMDPKAIIAILTGRKDDIKAVKDYAKESKTQFKAALDSVKEIENDIHKNEDLSATGKNTGMSMAMRAVNAIKASMSATQIWRSQTIHAINARSRQARRYGMAYVAAGNKNSNKGFNKDDHWKNESTEYGFLGNLGLV